MKSNDLFAHRLSLLQAQLLAHQAWLIATPSHITYLTNFHFLVPEEKEAWLVISQKQVWLIHASFCPTHGVTPFLTKLKPAQVEALPQHLNLILKSAPQLTEWYLDEQLLSIAEYKVLQNFPQLTLKTLDHQLIWNLRMVKDSVEQELCQQAGRIANQAFNQLKEIIKVGMSELRVKNLLDNLMIDSGAEKPAFPTIVAFGEHSALPHHQPDDRPLRDNTPVLIDFGAMVKGYRSDMTRTWWFGDRPSAQFLKIEKLVKLAYQRAVKQMAKRTKKLAARDLDQAAREVINRAGFNQEFIHTTGHGVGLDIHEPPSLSWKNETLIKPGMVITIEPGVYLTGQFGYRHENTMLILDQEVIELTNP